MRWGCQRNNQRSPKILLFVISLLRLLPSGVPLCMGRSAGKSSVPFQSQIPCSPCPGLTALAGVSCGIGGQPVLEVGVVGADEDGGVFLVKIDFGGLFLLGKSCSHRLRGFVRFSFSYPFLSAMVATIATVDLTVSFSPLQPSQPSRRPHSITSYSTLSITI